MTFGEKVRENRLSLHLTQEKLGELVGVSKRQQQLMDTVFADNGSASSELIRKVEIPALLPEDAK